VKKPYEPLSLPGAGDPLFREGEPLTGEIAARIFHREETGFSIYRLRPFGTGEPVTVLGILGELAEGVWIVAEGSWEENKTFGRQFRVTSFSLTDPKSREGMVRFLSSSLIRGIGPSTAEKIVSTFGDRTFNILDTEPHRLREISGIGPSKAASIMETWRAHRHLSRAMVFLQGYGVGPATAHRIVRRYGARTVEAISEDPYRLAEEVWGIGFRTADRIALSIGLPPDAPRRIQEALHFTLTAAVQDGHTFLPRQELFDGCRALIAPLEPDLTEHLALLTESGRVKLEQDRCYTSRMWQTETGLATQVGRILRSTVTHALPETVTTAGELLLSGEQQHAVMSAFKNGITVITGGPGTGKTTLIRAVVDMARGRGRPATLAAPTGRAAKRLSEACGMEAKTIHRLLEFDPKTGRFTRGLSSPLGGSLFIVDEVSMVDLPLMYAFFKAIPDGAAAVLVGDADQLPSVGPGAVLSSFISSGRIPTVRLSTVYRQAAESAIIRCSHEILRGEAVTHGKGTNGDFFFIEREDPEELAQLVVHLVSERIPRTYGLDPMTEIQVLVPRHKGELGTERFNTLLREALNPGGHPFTHFSTTWRVGDKVLQSKNNYDVNVFNGDLGVIEGVDTEEGEVRVRMDERSLVRPLADLSEMVPAYAISIHKSQGSEYPAVVIPLHTQHSIMLQRNLLYTAVTRARRLVVIVGSGRALRLAISNSFQVTRYETLSSRLASLP